MGNELKNTDREVQIIGADIGRGYVKGYSVFENQELECNFKSIVGTGREIDLGEYKENERIYLEVDNEDYFVGILAEKEADTPTPNSRELKTTATAEKLLYALLNKIAIKDRVKLMLGVPNQSFSKETFNSVLSKYKGKQISIKDRVTKNFKNIIIEDIMILRESDSALLWQLRDKVTYNKPVGMVTIGYRTTEFTYFDIGMKFNDKKSKSMELGNKTALEYVQRMLVTKGIKKELFEIDTNNCDYEVLKERCYKDLYEKVTQEIDNYWINLIEMDIFIGGGTALNMDFSEDKQFILIEDSQMATAKGLYDVGKKVFK